MLAPQVEAIEVHHLGPGGRELLDELPLAVPAGVDLGESAELGVGSKDEVNHGGNLLQIRTKVLNNQLRETFVRWYPGMQTEQETEIQKKAA